MVFAEAQLEAIHGWEHHQGRHSRGLPQGLGDDEVD